MLPVIMIISHSIWLIQIINALVCGLLPMRQTGVPDFSGFTPMTFWTIYCEGLSWALQAV